MFPGSGAANIGSAQGSITINTQGLNAAVNAVIAAVNRINGATNQIGQGGNSLNNNLAQPLNNINRQVTSLTNAARTLAAVFAGIKIGEMAMETSQALVAAQIRFEAMTGSAEKATAQITSIRDRAKELGVPVNQALNTFAGIAPLIQKGKTGLDAYVSVMSRLAVLEPMQGLEGAAFAIRETLSNVSSGLNNYRSLANRFNLSMGDIKKAMAESGNDVAIALDKVLNKMGITEDSAKRMANTFMAASRVLKDEFGRTLSNALGPIFDAVTPLIQDFTKFLTTLNDAVPGLLGFIGTLGAMTAAAIALSFALNKVGAAMKTLGGGGTMGKLAITGPSLTVGAEIGVAITRALGSIFNDDRLKSFELADAFNTLKQALFLAGMGLVDIFFKIAAAAVNFANSVGQLPERLKNYDKGFKTDAEIKAESMDQRTPLQKQIDEKILRLQDQQKYLYADDKMTQGVLQKQIDQLKVQRGLAGNAGATAPTMLTGEQLDAKINALLDLQKTKSAADYKEAYDAFVKETAPISGFSADALKILIERARVLRDLTQGMIKPSTPEAAGTGTGTTTPVVEAMSEDVAKITKDYLADVEKIEADAGDQRTKLAEDNEKKRTDIVAKYEEKRADLGKKLGEDLADLEAKRADDIAKVQGDQQEREAKTRADFADQETRRLEDHLKDMDRLQRDHDLTIREAAERLDAYAIAKENRSFAQRKADMEDQFGTETSRRKADLDKQIADQRQADDQRIAEINAQTGKERDKLLLKNKQALDDLAIQEKKEQDARIADYNDRLKEINDQAVKEKAARDKAYIDQLEEAGNLQAQLLNIMRRGGADIAAEQQKLIDTLVAQYKGAQPNILSFVKGLLPEDVQGSLDDLGKQAEGLLNIIKNVSDQFNATSTAAPEMSPEAIKARVGRAADQIEAFFEAAKATQDKLESQPELDPTFAKDIYDQATVFMNNAKAYQSAAIGMIDGTTAVGIQISNKMNQATIPLNQTTSSFQNWGTAVSNTVSSVYNAIKNIINTARAQSESMQVVRSGQRVATQFANGTSRLTDTGLFLGHKDEVVINPRSSETIRQMMGNGFSSNQLVNAVAAGVGRGGAGGTFQFDPGAIQVVLGDVGNRSDREIIDLAKTGFALAIQEFLAKGGKV